MWNRCSNHQEDTVLSLSSDAANTADKKAPSPAPKSADSDTQLARILSSLTEDKAEDIVQIDLRGKTAIGDYMVICSGRSSRQVSAITQKLAEKLKTELGVFAKIEGKDAGDWVLLDTGDVIVHVFRPEVREFYQLEKMWIPGAEAATTQS